MFRKDLSMRMKKYLLQLLCLSLLLSQVGCTKTTEETKAVDTQTTQDTNAIEETVDFENMSLTERMQYSRSGISDGLPERNYDGYTFRVQDIYNKRILRSLDDTGEAVDSAMYNRQLAIEDRFNIQIEPAGIVDTSTNVGFDQTYQLISNYLMAQEDSLDLLQLWNTMSASLVTQGYFLDLSTIDALDFSKPWFYQDAIHSLSYKNHVFLSVDMSIPFFSELQAVFYNKGLATDHGIEGLYDTVRNGEWTLDKFKELSQDLWVDTNGNGIVDADKDSFGAAFATAEFGYIGIPVFGVTLIGKDENDVPQLNVSANMERFDTVFTTMRDLIVESDSVCYTDWEITPFMEDRALFAVKSLGLLTSLRDTEFDYGVLPLFKWDENQANYSSAYLPYPNAIPGTVQDPERSAIVLSALASTGYKDVYPVYYDNALKSKLVRDEDSAEMIDVIVSNVIVDGSLMYADAGTGIYFFHFYMTSGKEFASYYASQSSAMQAMVEEQSKLLDKVIERNS